MSLMVTGLIDSSLAHAKQASCSSPAESRRVAIDMEGRKVVASGSGQSFVVKRFLADGSLDSDFGSVGVAMVSWGSPSTPNQLEEVPRGAARASAVLIQPDGKILVGGSYGGYGEVGQEPPASTAALARLNPDGSLDQSFGGENAAPGKVVSNRRPWTSILAIVLQGRRILAAGGGGFVARLTADGAIDRTFAKGHGSLNVPPKPKKVTRYRREARISAVFVTPSGKICARGTAGIDERRIDVRLRSNGTFDLSFGKRGIRWGGPQR